MDPSAGTLVSSKVRLVEPLANGGMGQVWAADHLGLGTRVAVKFLSEERWREDEVARARFEKEAGSSARVKSPHVVRTFDSGLDADGRPYIVMELLEGESLLQRLQHNGPLPLHEVTLVIEQVGRALVAAHKAGVVHRDVKPANIFLTSEGEGFFCKLLDFGVAKETRVAAIQGLTEAGTLIGTLEYMSPEQLMRPDDVDGSADLWALAVTAYCALTRELPFEGRSLGELCVKVLNAEVEPPSRHRSDLPKAIDDWFARAFHLRPEARFSDPLDMATTFAAACRGESPVHDDADEDDAALSDEHPEVAASLPAWPRDAPPSWLRTAMFALFVVASVGSLIYVASEAVDAHTDPHPLSPLIMSAESPPKAAPPAPSSAPPPHDALEETVESRHAAPVRRPQAGSAPAVAPTTTPLATPAPNPPGPSSHPGAAPDNPGF